MHGGDGPVLLDAGPQPHQRGVSPPVGVEDLLPSEGDLHRMSGDHGQLRHGDLVVEGVALPAEAATDGGRDHPDAVHRQTQDLGEGLVNVMGRLSARPEGQLTLRLPASDGGVLLHG